MSTFILTAAFYAIFSVNKWPFSIFLGLQGASVLPSCQSTPEHSGRDASGLVQQLRLSRTAPCSWQHRRAQNPHPQLAAHASQIGSAYPLRLPPAALSDVQGSVAVCFACQNRS